MTIAGIVVIVAAMMHAKVILVPFMMALLIVIVSRGPISWLHGKGLPEWLALFLVMIIFCAAILLTVMIVGSSAQDFLHNIPGYQTKLHQQVEQFYTVLGNKGVHLKGKGLHQIINPGAVMKYVGQLFSELSTLLANGFLVLLLAVFMALEVGGFPAKLRAVFGPEDTKILQFQKFNTSVREYMAIKTVVSLATGALVSLSLFVIGVDYPIMWGMLAFALNFIPNIGSIIAAVPAVLLAMVQLGLGSALTAAACYVVINVVVGNVIEPRFMGKGLGLSTLVVLLSLLFWGWVFGPIGMLLSVVLTMTLKMFLENSEETRWLALLLGPNPVE
jgi:predicted PurR-regulated permease PerM